MIRSPKGRFRFARCRCGATGAESSGLARPSCRLARYRWRGLVTPSVLDDLALLWRARWALSARSRISTPARGSVTGMRWSEFAGNHQAPIGAKIDGIRRPVRAPQRQARRETIIVEDIERMNGWLGSRWRDELSRTRSAEAASPNRSSISRGDVVGVRLIYHHPGRRRLAPSRWRRMATVLSL